MDIETIKKNIKKDFFDLSKHAEEERRKDFLTLNNLKDALFCGKIIESYPDDPRGPSCLVLGWSDESPVHLVCGQYESGKTLIITVYKPDPKKWDQNFEVRKKI